MQQTEHRVAVGLLLDQEGGRHATDVLLEAADLHLAVERVLVGLPVDEAVAHQQVVVEEVPVGGSRRTRVRELPPARPELVGEGDDPQALVGPGDEAAEDRVQVAPDDHVAVEGQHQLALLADLVVHAHVGAGVGAEALGARPAQDHAARVVEGLHGGDVGVVDDEARDETRLGPVERVRSRAELHVAGLPHRGPGAVHVVKVTPPLRRTPSGQFLQPSWIERVRR